ncbi:Holliday junction branch migration protein RuvA [Candidatus Berkelbacteria bacterium]|nr:Holliday junction branch migration protein RuvA [Candidatus Berkelbacteria bacterium]
MIRTLTGTVSHLMPDGLVVNVGGVGYLVAVPPRSIPHVGESIELFTYHHVREDELALYGFTTVGELQLFRELLTVPSIGPKMALAILSTAAPNDILSAIETDNLGFFQSLPGVGKKSAAKIIVELKGKLTANRETTIPSGGSELVEALMALGYRPDEVQAIVNQVPPDVRDTEAQVAWALRELGQPAPAR